MGCNFCGAMGALETPITAERVKEMQEQLLKILEKMPEVHCAVCGATPGGAPTKERPIK